MSMGFGTSFYFEESLGRLDRARESVCGVEVYGWMVGESTSGFKLSGFGWCYLVHVDMCQNQIKW
jgi:hypothetical protein